MRTKLGTLRKKVSEAAQKRLKKEITEFKRSNK